ncbi:hypothetical protein FJT64_011786 [Amphibalanus amphitrite]|uniref:Uncharacterized protein n=1 Tax=Amphibalanus amphitrite TaxID=1232801 RepID=A0A6A4VA58_AMPAM|nr:hypothetical protein FJT64_011786 [Amphibalanus amphitrite]
MGELAEDSDTDFTLVLTMLHKRVATIRFTRIYAIDTFVFVTGLAQPIPQWLSIFRPFRMTLWIVTIVSVLLAGLAAFGFTRFHPLPERRFTISLSILNTYGAMCENAQSRVPSHSTAAKVSIGSVYAGNDAFQREVYCGTAYLLAEVCCGTAYLTFGRCIAV